MEPSSASKTLCRNGLPARPVGAGRAFHLALSRAYIVCFACPWIWLFSEKEQARGIHAMIAKTPRIPP